MLSTQTANRTDSQEEHVAVRVGAVAVPLFGGRCPADSAGSPGAPRRSLLLLGRSGPRCAARPAVGLRATLREVRLRAGRQADLRGVHRHARVEDKEVPVPMLRPLFFEVVHDPTLQRVQVRKALLPATHAPHKK
jgi:hypothetical protein